MARTEQDGKTPIPGIDFPIPKDGINGKDGKSPIKGVDYFDGKNGLDADPELVKELVLREIEIPVFEKLENELPKLGDKVRDSLELLQGNDRLDKSAIKGLDDLERRIDGKHFPVMGGGTPVSVSYNGVLKDKEVRNINFIGDGVASVTQTNGTVDVSINGGDETDPIWTADKPSYLTSATASTTYLPIIANADVDLGAFDLTTTGTALVKTLGVGLSQTGTSPLQAIDVSGNINITQVVDPVKAGVTFTGTTGGALDAGAVYHYSISFVTADGDTGCFNDSWTDITLGASENAVIIQNIPISVDPRVTGRRIYRSNGGGSVATGGSILINNNTATSYTDTTADESLSTSFGTMYRKDNLTTKGIYVNNILMAKLGKYNTGIGSNVLGKITTGYENFALGKEAVRDVTSGNNNIGIGSSADVTITTGSSNIGIGYTANYFQTTGNDNVSIGSAAGRMSVTGSKSGNVAIGSGALNNSITGNSYNTALGYYAGNNFQGSSNIFIGQQSGYLASATTAGNYNIFIGDDIGDNATTGADNNILIGKQLDLQVANGDNQLSIGNLIFGTGLDGTGTTVSSGNVGIAVNAPSARLHLPASAATADKASLKIDAGTLATTPVSGNIESDGTHLYWTDSGGTRRQLD